MKTNSYDLEEPFGKIKTESIAKKAKQNVFFFFNAIKKKERKRKKTQDRFSAEIISKCVPALAQTVESNPFWERRGG